MPLAMSCSSAPSSSSSGRRQARGDDRVDVVVVGDRRGDRPRRAAARTRATASSRCRSTVKRWYALRCGRDRTCSHSGSSRTSTPSWSSASNTGTASAPARSRRTNAARCQTSQVGSRVARSRVSEVRSNGASCSAAARRGLERAQRGHGTVGVGVDVHAAVAQHHPFGQRLVAARRLSCRARRACRARATTRRRRSTRSHAPPTRGRAPARRRRAKPSAPRPRPAPAARAGRSARS